jgi:predicted ABC-class ATPase
METPVADAHVLTETLNRIDGRGYKSYSEIRGRFDFDRFTLFVDHIQGDPFAAPSKLRIRVPAREAGLPASWAMAVRTERARKSAEAIRRMPGAHGETTTQPSRTVRAVTMAVVRAVVRAVVGAEKAARSSSMPAVKKFSREQPS